MRIGYLAILLTFPGSAAYADGLFFKLPKDGTWATYEGDLITKAAGRTTKWNVQYRVASVGQVKENGESCRYIEVSAGSAGAKGQQPLAKSVWKFLVPEKRLVQGETPQDYVIRVWERKNGKPTTAKGPWPFFVGPPSGEKRLGKVEVDSKLGKLMCDGTVGEIQLKTSYGRVGRFRTESRLNSQAPFGVVSVCWNMEFSADEPKHGSDIDSTETKLRLMDFGDEAKSEMPDAK